MKDFNKITAKDNPLIKLVCALQSSSKSRRENCLFVLEGLRICLDALDNSIAFDKLIVSETFFNKHSDSVNTLSQNSNLNYLIPDSLFVKISDTDSPQGVIALVKIPKENKTVCANGRYVALENIQDPSNLGAISRTAEALGISGIVLKSGCDPFSPKSLRASMGTLLRLPLYFTDDLSEFVNEYNLRSFACVVDSSAENISNINFLDGDILIIGNEANGITEETANNSYKKITIPMRGSAESLNAAAAAAIAMWELQK